MADLRAHRRLTVDFEAFVTAPGMREQPCRVRDFCLGGALLSFDDPLRTIPPALAMIERGASLEVRVLTRSPGLRDTYVFAATVARREKMQLGVAFSSPDPTALMALQSLANINSTHLRTGIRPERRKGRPDENFVQSAMQALRQCVEQAIAELPAKLLNEARISIDALVAATKSDEESRRLHDSLVTLRRHGGNFQSEFLRQALKPLTDFDKWQPGAIIPAASNTYRLSLIEKGAFEDWLAIKVMVSRAESECQESLFELHIRLNELLGTTLAVQSNPVGPAVFFHALGEPLQKLRLPKQVEQSTLRLLESQLLACLKDLYPRLNALMVKQGVLPDMELGKHLRAIASSTSTTKANPAAITTTATASTTDAAAGHNQQAGAETSAAPLSAAGHQSPALAHQTQARTADRSQGRAALSVRQFELQHRIAGQAFATMQRLLAMHQTAPAADATHEAGSAPVFLDAAALDQTLKTLCQSADTDSANNTKADNTPLRERLAGHLGNTPEHALAPAQLAAIDTIDELFAQMLATTLLREETRDLLRQLDVPFLRLMLNDPAFLSDDQHPARQVINRIATLGARGALTTAQQQASMRSIVLELTAADIRDPAVIRNALSALDDLLAKQQRIHEHNLRRVQQSSAGRHRLDDARRRINQIVEDLIGGQRVPRALLTLLDAGWRESMINSVLRHGENSDAFRAQVAVIKDMLQSVRQPETLDMKALLGAIKHGLAAQANGQINREAVVSDLRELFTAISSGQTDALPCVEVPAGAVVVTDVPAPAEDSHTLGRWQKRAREIQVGDWLEFLADNEAETHQARLAWRDDECNRFVFVNLQGMKVDELDAETLARALRDTRVWRIDDPQLPIVDRGLEAMVQKVYGQLSHRATHDELTGLLNRKEFEKRLQAHLGTVGEGAQPWILCWLDLDQFRIVNGTCGFEAGNALLVEVARAITGSVAESALVARLGGDEFAILAPAAGDDGRLGPVGPVIEAIDRLRFQWQGTTYPVGASAGVVFVTALATTAEDLMNAAETACYAAKEAGRNRVQVFQADDAQLAQRDDVIRWVSRLNQALENNRLQLRCQLIRPIDSSAGLLPHYEILIAIEDEKGEFLPPSSFMQAAERYNRMHAVDRWVVRHVLEWMHTHPDAMQRIGGFSINLSGQSLNDEKLTTYILREVAESAVAREKITFEVTETAAIANLADAADFIRELQAIGCRFSLDDFGSGLSSYSYLKNLPVDFVKIDGVFIRDIHRNMSDFMMVRSINEMAHFMGKQTIAEYVENDEILEKLREIGIDFAQGYGIERPRALDSLRD